MPHTPYHVEDMLIRTSQNWPEADTVVTVFVNRLFRLRDLLLEDASKEMARFDLSPVEFAVLSALRKMRPPHELRPSDLYNAMFVTSGGMTKILRGLEARQLIARMPDAQDRRSVRVRLTTSGKSLIEDTMSAVQASQTALLSRAGNQVTITAVADGLGRFTSALDR